MFESFPAHRLLINLEIYVDSTYKTSSLETEVYREYDFDGRVYRIDNPITLTTRNGGTTHRVVDSACVTHCVPAPGQVGCVLRWKTKDPETPVNF